MNTSTSYAETDAADAASRLADKAKDLGARASAVVGDKADAVMQQVRPKIDAVGDYVRTEPTKAMLIAAAAGAGLMALIALAARPSPASAVKKMDSSDFASLLRDFASQAPRTASDAADAGKKKASAAADLISDTWQQLRDQAGPVVDRIRPQIDAVTSYAKDEPAKTAAGVALAGAVVAGLVALLRSRMDD